MIACANPTCSNHVGRTAVSVDVRRFVNCNDHDEVLRVDAFVTCSYDCLAAVADERVGAAAAPEPEPF